MNKKYFRKTICLLLLFLVIGCASMMPQIDTYKNDFMTLDKKLKMTVLSESNKKYFLTDAIATVLINHGFNIIERNELNEILREMKLSLSGLLEQNEYKKIGELAQVDIIVIVSSKETEYGDVAAANVRFIDIKSGKILIGSVYSNAYYNSPGTIGYMNINSVAKMIAESINDKYK